MKKITIRDISIDPSRSVTEEELKEAGAIIQQDPSEQQIREAVDSIKSNHRLWNLFLQAERGVTSFSTFHSDVDAHLREFIKDETVSFAPIILAVRAAAIREK